MTSVVHSSSQNGVYVNVGRKFFCFNQKKCVSERARKSKAAKICSGRQAGRYNNRIRKKDIRKVVLSVKRLEETEQRKQIKKFGSKDSGGVLGEILGPLLYKKKTKDKKK